MIRKFPKIKGYHIKKKLGQGGMASVYLGIDKRLHKMVAVKVFVLTDFGSQKKAKRFLKEAQILSRLTHPNIVDVLKVEKTGQYYTIVMEYLQTSLREVIDRQDRIPPHDALKIVYHISEALTYLHKRGIVHRDVKPGNIMFRQDMTPVLLDFGIVKTFRGRETQLTETGTFVGTPYYMSPEQCTLQKIDRRSDLYSLGVVLFEMLRGRVPFRGKNAKEVFQKHLSAPIPRLPRGVAPVQPLIEVMMAKEKRKRIRSQKRIAQMIVRLLNDPSLAHSNGPDFSSSQSGKYTLSDRTLKSDLGEGEVTLQSLTGGGAKAGKHTLRRILWITLLAGVLGVLALRYGLGYSYKTILVTGLKGILYGFKMLVDFIASLFDRGGGQPAVLIRFLIPGG